MDCHRVESVEACAPDGTARLDLPSGGDRLGSQTGVVTGWCGGIGRAVVIAFVEAGAPVTSVDVRNAPSADRLGEV